MHHRSQFKPSAARRARVDETSTPWTLLLHRDLPASPHQVWDALTDPAQLREWAPFNADRGLGQVGEVTLTTVAAQPTPAMASAVTTVDPAKLLAYRWGTNNLRWELQATEAGTQLTLAHNLEPQFVAWGAAGWHICLDVLEHWLQGTPLGRIVGADAMAFDWARLNEEYADLFELEVVPFPSTTP